MTKPNDTVLKYTSQEQYVRNHHRNHRNITLYRLTIFILFLGIWQLSAYMGWIDTFFFSCPSQVVTHFTDMLLHNSLLMHIGITLYETLLSFLLVVVLGILSATLLWYLKSVSKVVEPYLVVLNSLPKSALAPLFIVWLGANTKTIIIAGISVALFGTIISLYAGFQNVDPEKLILIHTLNGSRMDAFYKVVLPSSIPVLLSTTKVNIGLSLVGVIIGEFLAARRGLGYLIIYGTQIFRLDMVITAILILCVIAAFLYLGIQKLEHHYKKRF